MQHYKAIAAVPPSPVVVQCQTQQPFWGVAGPISLMIGTHKFDQMDHGFPLWKWTPADSYKKALFLLKLYSEPWL